MNITLEPSWWTPITWPRYGLKYKLFGIPFVLLCGLFLFGLWAIGPHLVVGVTLVTLSLVLYVVIGGLTLSVELYQNSTG